VVLQLDRPAGHGGDMGGKAEVVLNPRPGQPPDGLLHRLAARRHAADDRRQDPAAGARRVDGRPRRAAGQRDRRGRARQRLSSNGADFDFAAGAPPKPGYIKLITPSGHVRQVAGDIQFPNGMVITPDGRTLIISESFAGRLTAFRHRG
jgi:hypothetical protein